jgi:hypothetical protein
MEKKRDCQKRKHARECDARTAAADLLSRKHPWIHE